MQTGVSPTPVVLGADPASAAAAAGSSASAPSMETDNLLFNVDKLNDAVTHANDMTKRYGVEILSINIISAKPAHDELMQSLAKGAVAAAEAQQLETSARGRAKAATIMAKGEAVSKASSSLILGNDPNSMGSMLLANPEIFKQ